MAHRPDIVIVEKCSISPRGTQLFAPYTDVRNISLDDTVEFEGCIYDIFDIRPFAKNGRIGAVIQIDIEKLLERRALGTDRIPGNSEY